jgi:hypothetical protein
MPQLDVTEHQVCSGCGCRTRCNLSGTSQTDEVHRRLCIDGPFRVKLMPRARPTHVATARRHWSEIVSLRRKLTLDRVASRDARSPRRSHSLQAVDSHCVPFATSIRNTDTYSSGLSPSRYCGQTPHSPGSARMNYDFDDEWRGWRLRGRHLVSEDGCQSGDCAA